MILRAQVGTLAAVAVAACIAWAVGGPVGVGVLGGALLGCAVAGLCVAMQMKMAREAPNRVMQAMGVAFLVKFLAMIAVGVALHLLDPSAASADWRAALIAFPAAALTVSLLGSLDVARTLKEPRAL